MPVTAFKDSLMTALHAAVGHFNAGLDPDAAVVKSAKDHDFNADQASRLVETFNTARTIFHYKSAADRTVDFKLADADAVIPQLYATDDTAAPDAGGNFNYDEYERPELHWAERKKASAVDFDAPTDYADTNLDTLASRANKYIRTHRQLAEMTQDESRVSATKAASILAKLASSLSTGYEENCRDRYGRLVSGYAYNNEFQPVVAKLGEFMPAQYQEVMLSKMPVVDDSDLGPEIALMKQAKEWMEAEAEMLALSGHWDKAAADFEAEFTAAIAPILPQKRASAGLACFLNPRLLKAAAGGSGFAGGSGAVQSNPKEQPKEKVKGPGPTQKAVLDIAKKPLGDVASGMVQSGLSSLVGGADSEDIDSMSSRLKNVQRQLIMEDLMVNDPVLSEEDPQVITQAYESVLQLAPELSRNKEVMRAILRQAVHSVAISPYEAKVWTDIEKNIKAVAGKGVLTADKADGTGGPK